jgi:hypothetical protein
VLGQDYKSDTFYQPPLLPSLFDSTKMRDAVLGAFDEPSAEWEK